MTRPWEINTDVWEQCMVLFPLWLQERGGIVVYENHMLDSSRCGDRTYMPARYYATDHNGTDVLCDAPDEWRTNGGVPSCRQQKVDHIKLDEFGGDLARALEKCFQRVNTRTMAAV